MGKYYMIEERFGRKIVKLYAGLVNAA